MMYAASKLMFLSAVEVDIGLEITKKVLPIESGESLRILIRSSWKLQVHLRSQDLSSKTSFGPSRNKVKASHGRKDQANGDDL